MRESVCMCVYAISFWVSANMGERVSCMMMMTAQKAPCGMEVMTGDDSETESQVTGTGLR